MKTKRYLTLLAFFALPSIVAWGQMKELSDNLQQVDPHGFGLTAMCMGVVFLCLALLYVFFLIFGWFADRSRRIAVTQPIKPMVRTAKKIEKVRQITTNILQEGIELKGRDKEVYVAVISLALNQYFDDVHDVESGVLTIKPARTSWNEHNTFNNQLTLHNFINNV